MSLGEFLIVFCLCFVFFLIGRKIIRIWFAENGRRTVLENFRLVLWVQNRSCAEQLR